jgi:Tfp pilus assembly protein PilN
MFNLLPEKEKQSIVKEYSSRRLIVILAFVFVLGIVSAVSMFPSYLLSSARVKEVETQISAVRRSTIFTEATELEAKLQSTNQKIDLLMSSQKATKVEDLISEIISQKDSSIRFTGFNYKKSVDKTPGSFSVSGIARDRESLSTFVRVLQNNERFSTVNLPVSSLAKDKNAEFTLQITGSF